MIVGWEGYRYEHGCTIHIDMESYRYGGMLTVYYQDPTQLRNVSVDAAGGDGGRGDVAGGLPGAAIATSMSGP